MTASLRRAIAVLAAGAAAITLTPARGRAQEPPPPPTDMAPPAQAPAEQAPATTTDVTTEVSAESIGEMPQPGFWEGGGVHVTDGTVFHPSVEISSAYETNVFYQDTDDGPSGPVGAALARFTVGGALGTVTPGRMQIESPGSENSQRLIFNIEGLLTWNQYFSSETTVKDQSDLGIGLNASATFNPNGKVTFGVRDAFIRNVNPGQSLREDLDRDRNELSANLTWKPGGGAIETYLNYTFIVNVFESSVLLFADRMTHLGAIGAKWRWLPRTLLSLEASIGIVTPNDTTLKPSSMPLRVWAGASTLLTPVFGFVVRAGYGNGFYSSGESVSTYLATAEVRWAIGPTLRTAAGYSHDFGDALVGNFYTDHTIYARAGWQLLDRWLLRASGELRLRSYGGIHDTAELMLCGDASCGKFRDDVLARVDASVEYQITKWLFAGAAYDLQADSTDFYVQSVRARDSGRYTAHELLLRLAARF